MQRDRSLGIATVLFTASLAAPAVALAHPVDRAQVCTLGAAAAGQPGTIICKDARTGATTQSIAVGNTMVGPGGTGGTLSRRGSDVLVTNLASGAILFDEIGGKLVRPVQLQTGGEGSLSGAIGAHGEYVVTATRLVFFPHGRVTAASSAPLMIGDGSVSQVVLAGDYAYVAEKTGSLEAFALRADGNLDGAATPVAGIPAGTIVGITGVDDLVISPVAHLATNANQSTVPVVSGTTLVQLVPTKEVAACWAANDDGEVCVANPGSMTISCGRVTAGGLASYTGAAATPNGESVFDLDIRHGLVGVLGVHNGANVLMMYERADEGSDFLSSLGEIAVGAATATGALILPPLSR